MKLPEIALFTPKIQSCFFVFLFFFTYITCFLDDTPLMLAEAEIVVFILSVDVYQTMDFKSVGINKGFVGFPGGSVMKNPPANAGDTGLIPG